MGDHAKLIYNNNMTETASDNNGMDLGPTEQVISSENTSEPNKTSLYESTRKLLEQSSQKVSNAVSETKEHKEKMEQEKAIELQNGNSANTSTLVDNSTISNMDEEEREELIKRKQYEKEIREKEQMLRAEKRKQWAAEEKERAAKE